MTIAIEVGGNSNGTGFLVAPDGVRTFPVPLRLRTLDGSTQEARLELEPGGADLRLDAQTMTVGPDGMAVSVHAMSQSQRRGDTVLNVLVDNFVQVSFQLTAIANPKVIFQGRFQARFATNGDEYNEPRGTPEGWTWALEAEPDFVPEDSVADAIDKPVGRVIRFHHPVALRRHTPPIGVFIKSVTGTLAGGAEEMFTSGDPLIGQPVRLGPASYFAGNRPFSAANRPAESFPDAREPIANFEFHISDWFSGTSRIPTDRPIAGGLLVLTPKELNDYGIVQASLELDPTSMPIGTYLNALQPFLNQFNDARRALLLDDYNSLTPEDRDGTVAGRNLRVRIAHLGGDAAAGIMLEGISTLRQGFWGKEEYVGRINHNLHFAPDGSAVISYLAGFADFQFFAKFFNFHADELCGQVDGSIAPAIDAVPAPVRSIAPSLSRLRE